MIRVWINGWVNNREAGDLRRHRVHYDVIVMKVSNNSIQQDIVLIGPNGVHWRVDKSDILVSEVIYINQTNPQ